MSRILVLLSGGMDSATCLGLAAKRKNIEDIKTLNITYGQKHVKEIICAQNIAKHYGVDYACIDLSEIMKYSNCPLLAHSTETIEHTSYVDQLKELGGEGTVNTYVPFRNGLMLSVAASYALSVDCDEIYYGAHKDDAAGRAYPDTTPAFSTAMNTAIYEGTGRKIKMIAPLLDFNKTDIAKCGLDLNVPYELTWSCYEGHEKACGTCSTCRDRIQSFINNDSEDPIEYEKEINWERIKC